MAKPEVFHIHSTTRDVTTRAQRAAAPGRMKSKMYLGGGMLRLVRKRATPITKALLVKLRGELIARQARGELKVTLLDGRQIDLETLEPVQQKAAPTPKPAPPDDSVANDKTFDDGVGEDKPQVAGGVPLNADLEVPAAMKAMPEGEDVSEVPTEPPPEVSEEGPSVVDDTPPEPKRVKKKTTRSSRKSARGR